MGIVQKESIRLTIVSYAGAALGYLNKILLFTNFLLPDQVGLVNILANLSILYAQFAALGMGSISIRFFPFFNNKEKKHHGFLFWGNCVVMVGFLITTIFFIILKPWVVRHYSNSSPLLVQYYYYLVPMALATVYFQFFDSYLRSLLKAVVSTFLYEMVGRLLVTASITLYALKWINFQQFVLIYVLSNCLLTILLLVYMAYLRQLFIMPVKSRLFKRLFKIIMLYGIFTIMSTLGGSILANVDAIMVTAKLNLAQAGIYTTIFFIATVMSFPFRSLTKITFPIVARYWKQKDMASMAELYKKATLVTMVLGGILFLGLWINIDNIFSFMPKEYAAGKYAFLLLAIARYVDMVTGLNGIITVTSKKFRYDLWFTLLLVILTIAMNFIFIPIYGITGAAMATAISVVVYNILRLLFVHYYFNMQPFTYNCAWVLAITLAVWGTALLIPTMHNKYIDICVKSAIITLLYGSSILYFNLSPDVNELAYKFTKWKFLKTEK